jgi:prevent-host-death family protein
MKSITMLEFRRDAQRILKAVGRGQRILLTYRGKPVACLEPVRPQGGSVAEDDALLRVDDFSLDGPGGPLQNEEIDAVIYGATIARKR